MGIDEIINEAPLIRQKEVQNKIDCKAVSVQVAGTNGKGSTCAFLSSILIAHGKRVGLYTSPSISDICERISINKENISRNEFEKLLVALDNRENGMCKSDLMFFSAVEYFNSREVDYAIFETGLGGTRDSATLINHSFGIITQIGLDHTELLGNRIEDITMEKAGIIKKGMNIYCYPNSTNYLIENKCHQVGARLKQVGRNEVEYENGIFNVDCHGVKVDNVRLLLHGDFQGYNFTCALLCAKDMLGDEFDLSIARGAIEKTKVYGRMTIIKERPLVIADVSHNPDGINELCRYIDGLEGRKCAIVSIQQRKDYQAMIKRLEQSFGTLIGVCADESSRSAEDMKTELSANSAFEAYAIAECRKSDIIVFCGSFSLIRDVAAMEI